MPWEPMSGKEYPFAQDLEESRALLLRTSTIDGSLGGYFDRSEQHRGRLFEEALEGPEELGGEGAVDGAVVGGQGDGHHRPDGQGVADDDGPLLGRGHGEDADLGRVEDGVELADAVHAQVADR